MADAAYEIGNKGRHLLKASVAAFCFALLRMVDAYVQVVSNCPLCLKAGYIRMRGKWWRSNALFRSPPCSPYCIW